MGNSYFYGSVASKMSTLKNNSPIIPPAQKEYFTFPEHIPYLKNLLRERLSCMMPGTCITKHVSPFQGRGSSWLVDKSQSGWGRGSFLWLLGSTCWPAALSFGKSYILHTKEHPGQSEVKVKGVEEDGGPGTGLCHLVCFPRSAICRHLDFFLSHHPTCKF